MSNFLVLVHSIATGDVVRQWVTDAESAAQAVEKYGERLLTDVEHAIAIPTGSEPTPEPVKTPEPVTTAPATPDTAETPAAPATDTVTATPDTPVTPAAAPATPDTASLIAQELSTLPADVLAKVLSIFKDAE
jgi:hypothetical protein